MKRPVIRRFSTLVLGHFLCVQAFAQEPGSPGPGGTTLGERTVPAPAGLSPEMLEVVKERQFDKHLK